MNDLESTLKTIKSAGYWMFHVRPVKPVVAENMTYQSLQQLVRESSVQLRGWDVPHVPTSTAEHQDLYNIDQGIESWSDFGSQKEVWRLFFDGEFIFYVALDEDWFGDDDWLRNQSPFNAVKPNTILNPIGGVIYQLTEMVEFVKRLVTADLLQGNIHLHLELRNAKGRKLGLLDPGRVPFHGVYAARQNVIQALDETILGADLRRQSADIAARASLKVLNMFQWNSVSLQQINEEQQKLFKREFH